MISYHDINPSPAEGEQQSVLGQCRPAGLCKQEVNIPPAATSLQLCILN